MLKLEYSEAASIFEEHTIWTNEYELYWYQHAWDILEQAGVTVYHNTLEYYQIIFYAIVLVHVYGTFCGYAFDENENTDLEDLAEDIPDIALGQLVKALLPYSDYCEDRVEAINAIFDTLKYDVFRFLKSKMTESEVFAWMYCTAYSPAVEAEYDEELEEYVEPDELINNAQEYQQFVEQNLGDVVNEVTPEKLEAFDYVSSLMS